MEFFFFIYILKCCSRISINLFKWLHTDIVKEESDTIVASGLEPSDIGKAINAKGRIWYFAYLNNNNS